MAGEDGELRRRLGRLQAPLRQRSALPPAPGLLPAAEAPSSRRQRPHQRQQAALLLRPAPHDFDTSFLMRGIRLTKHSLQSPCIYPTALHLSASGSHGVAGAAAPVATCRAGFKLLRWLQQRLLKARSSWLGLHETRSTGHALPCSPLVPPHRAWGQGATPAALPCTSSAFSGSHNMPEAGMGW